MGETVGHDSAAAASLLQAVVANGLRGANGFLDVANLQHVPAFVGVKRPYACETIGHQFHTHREAVSFRLAACALLRLLYARQNAHQVFDVVANFMRDHVGVGEIATAAEFALHVTKERRVEINLLVGGAIKRPHCRLRCAAG